MSQESSPRKDSSLRSRLSTLFDDDLPQSPAARLFNTALGILIIVNIGAVILESVEQIRPRFSASFEVIEHVATAVFAAEYVLRVWTCVDLSNGQYRQPLWGRLRYMVGFFAVIDLIAVLPAILGFLGAADLRVLRLLRLLRMVKLTRRSSAFGLLWAVLREEASAIMALIFAICLTLTISGALMYMLEGREQPNIFSSIPAGMWWAIETITTVGYGDMVPVTFAGRVLGGIISVVGIGTLALFSGLITVSYINQLRLRRERAHHHKSKEHEAGAAPFVICPHCGGHVVTQTAEAAPQQHKP
ncbi:MAG: ion transporter [Methylovirgula sp.]